MKKQEPEVRAVVERALPARLGLWARTLRYFRDPRVKLWRKLVGLWAVLYVASPIDLVPDFLPLLGWLDDVGVLSAVAWYLVKQIGRHASETPPGPTPAAGG